MDNVKIYPNQHSRDVLLIHILTEIRTTQVLIANIYAKTFNMPYEEAVETTKKIGADIMIDVLTLVAKHGELDVDGLKDSLGL